MFLFSIEKELKVIIGKDFMWDWIWIVIKVEFSIVIKMMIMVIIWIIFFCINSWFLNIMFILIKYMIIFSFCFFVVGVFLNKWLNKRVNIEMLVVKMEISLFGK